MEKVRQNDGEYVLSLYKFEKRTVGDDVESVMRGFFSFATWPFYGTIVALVVLVERGGDFVVEKCEAEDRDGVGAYEDTGGPCRERLGIVPNRGVRIRPCDFG